jgi:DNA-binding winged helix-turn-helix (wHTH) protein
MIHRFGAFELDPERFELRCEGRIVEVEPQVLEVLGYLVGADGRVVSKDELVEKVWHGRFVTDAAVSRSIQKLRRALGADHSRWIDTVRGRGYRFSNGDKVAVGREDDGWGSLAPERNLPTSALRPFALPVKVASGEPGESLEPRHEKPDLRGQVLELETSNMGADAEDLGGIVVAESTAKPGTAAPLGPGRGGFSQSREAAVSRWEIQGDPGGDPLCGLRCDRGRNRDGRGLGGTELGLRDDRNSKPRPGGHHRRLGLAAQCRRAAPGQQPRRRRAPTG